MLKNKTAFYMKSPSSRGGVCKGCFSNSTPISGVNFWVEMNNEWNWTRHNIWNLLTINLKDKFYSIMLGENFPIYSVQITGKCICEAPPPFA